jgi:hypothetical protein
VSYEGKRICVKELLLFTSDERQRLEVFCEACDKAAGCRFIRTFFDQPHHIFMGTLPDGRVVDEYPRYDEDDFLAFLTHYRKLRMDKEPTHLFRIMNTLKQKGNEADRSVLDYLKNEIQEEGRCWWGSMHPDEGYTEALTQERLENLMLNGEVFHSDVQKRNELAQLIGNRPLPKAVALLNYMRFARTVLGCAQKTAALIRERGYLAEACVPSAGS